MTVNVPDDLSFQVDVAYTLSYSASVRVGAEDARLMLADGIDLTNGSAVATWMATNGGWEPDRDWSEMDSRPERFHDNGCWKLTAEGMDDFLDWDDYASWVEAGRPE